MEERHGQKQAHARRGETLENLRSGERKLRTGNQRTSGRRILSIVASSQNGQLPEGSWLLLFFFLRFSSFWDPSATHNSIAVSTSNSELGPSVTFRAFACDSITRITASSPHQALSTIEQAERF